MSEGLSDEAARLRSGYEAMFGAVPDMVAARIRFVGEVAPRFQTLTEALRSDALVNGVLDDRTVQLFLFGLLLTTRPAPPPGMPSPPAAWEPASTSCSPSPSSSPWPEQSVRSTLAARSSPGCTTKNPAEPALWDEFSPTLLDS